MPFCPQCRFEYTAAVSRCPDCGAELVDSLPAEEPPARSNLAEAELCVVDGEIHARLLQNALAGQGIACRLQSASPFASPFGVPGLRPTFGLEASTAIFVRRSDLARAQVVYEDLERHGSAEEEEAESPD